MKVVEVNVYLVKAGMLHPVICEIIIAPGIGARLAERVRSSASPNAGPDAGRGEDSLPFFTLWPNTCRSASPLPFAIAEPTLQTIRETNPKIVGQNNP